MTAWQGTAVGEFHLWHPHNYPMGMALLSRLGVEVWGAGVGKAAVGGHLSPK